MVQTMCMAIANSGKKGNWDFDYPKIYSLSFLNFDLDFKNDDVVQYISLSNEVHPEIRYDYINMVFVRLPRFNKRLEECQTLQDKLIFSLRHAHELKEKPEQFGEEVFEKIFDIAKIAKFSKDEREKYEAIMRNELDQYAILKCARDEGREEGEARGITIGEARGLDRGREEVFSLLESGVSLAEAKRRLGL